MTAPESIYEMFLQHPDVSTDTRDIRPGSIFFALKGDRFDGNLFASEALEKGAALAVVDNPSLGGRSRFIIVDDTLCCLQELAAMHRKRMNAIVLAVTGTNGKTTTKELVSRVLATTFRTVSTRGNLNNQIGVPLTLLEMNERTEFAVVEMGANHPGEIAALCHIARPGYGLITNIGKAHLEGFGGIRGVIRTKSELYDHLRNFSGTAFVNLDHPVLARLSKGIDQVTYGRTPGVSCRGRILSQRPFLRVGLRQDDRWLPLTTSLYGAYNFENVLAAACIGNYFHVPAEAIARGVASYVPDNNRSQVIRTPAGNTLIMDAYNANPTSMASAIRSFHGLPGKCKMLILGDMLELGDASLKEHQAIVRLLLTLGFHHVILAGEVFSSLTAPGEWHKFTDTLEAREWLRQLAPTGFTILLKGSRKIKLESLTDLL